MSMEGAAWSSLYKISTAKDGKHGLSRASLRRIMTFAVPYRWKLVVFIALSVVGAFLAVATPVLAGQVVDVIAARGEVGTIVRLAVVIALVAVADAGASLLTRWYSARIGEGVILDLRTAVFDHVQKMPIAFFTRTRTGALVSRLNNDVIGAQQAFSGTLSGVVTNLVALVLTLVVMLSTSWLVTVIAVVMLPLFLVPARRMGTRLAALRREAADHNSAMSTQMTERFSAPGATLVKLFGRPDEESEEFRVRAARVRDIGVRTAMLQFVFVTALTLVAALALALVYGLGGALALGGQLNTGDVVTLALLLTRLYVPLTSLANARVEIMSAVVSFERVFEVLDIVPLIQEKPDAVTVPDGPVAVEFDDVRFAYPSADKVSLASLEEVSTLDTRGGDEVLHGVSFRIEPGQTVALVGTSGAGKSTIAQLLSRLANGSPLGQVFAAGLRNVKSSPAIMKEAIEESGRTVAIELERFLTSLGTVAVIAPLLGLFGTVVGMIEIFGSQTPQGSNPIVLAHGISIALYNTAFGLIVAVPAMIFYRYFRAKVDEMLVDMEMQAIKLLEIIHGERQ